MCICIFKCSKTINAREKRTTTKKKRTESKREYEHATKITISLQKSICKVRRSSKMQYNAVCVHVHTMDRRGDSKNDNSNEKNTPQIGIKCVCVFFRKYISLVCEWSANAFVDCGFTIIITIFLPPKSYNY